jgi:hypothetical protein
MSLFDKLKTTRFKSLKYGDDSFGGGDSLEPIIQKPIRNDNPVGVERPAKDVAAENRARIDYLLNKTSRGIQFVQHQKGLTLSNTRLEPTNASNAKTRISPQIIYNPNNTLAQIGEDPSTGTHFDRFGLTPIMDDSYKYFNIATQNNKSNNRLVNLQKNLQVGIGPNNRLADFKSGVLNALSSVSNFLNTVTGISNIFGGSPFLNNLNNKVNQITKIATPYLSPTIDQYNGGPNSKYGVGFTSIRRFDYTNNTDKTDLILKLGKTAITTRKNLLNDSTLRVSKTFNQAGGKAEMGFNNMFSAEIKNSVYNLTPNTSGGVNYNDIIRKSEAAESRTHTVLEKTSVTGGTYKYKTSKKSPEKAKTGNIINFINGKLNVYNDTTIDNRMPIVFTIIDPFTGKEEPTKYSFSAYINGFKDTSTPSHTEVSYIGRSEHFYVYDKFTRSVSFNFQIPCYGLGELRDKHKSLAALYSSTMGKYDGDKLGGILYKLKLGNYLNNEAGIITSISYDIPNDSPWDIDEQLAHNINVSVSFTVIHNKLPQYRSDGSLFTVSGSVKEVPSLDLSNILRRVPTQFLPVNLPAIPNINIQNPTYNNSPSTPKPQSSGGMLGMSQ